MSDDLLSTRHVSLIVCPECDLMMSEMQPAAVDDDIRITHWRCWRCWHRFGVSVDQGTLDLGITESRSQVEG